MAPPVSWRLAGAAIACALLLQAVLAVPLAVRMAAEVLSWAQVSITVCTAVDESGVHSDLQPVSPSPLHKHGQCQICQAHALPFGLPLILLAAVAIAFKPALLRRLFLIGPPPRRGRYEPYLSRAPPVGGWH